MNLRNGSRPWQLQSRKNKEDVCICIDPRDLNKAILRPHYPSCTIEEVIARMPAAIVFSVLDASTGFWQIPLDYESWLATTFNSPYGGFRFLRLPYGITSTSEVLQKAMDHLFSGVPCEIIINDILIWGKDDTEHNANPRKVLDRVREVHLQLNPAKCKFQVSTVPYVGHLLMGGGLKSDPDKVKAVRDMPSPDSPQARQRFLGMVNCLAKFIPHLTNKTEPLRELSHKESAWFWFERHAKAFTDIKEAISTEPVLAFYDKNKPITLTCDASKSGLEATCLQDGRPVTCASQALMNTQTKYAQIEKEMLAMVFTCKKFHDFIFGKEITVETDHQPLVSVHKKPLFGAPMRLQKMLLQLQLYNITLVYKPGSTLHIADALSRREVCTLQTLMTPTSTEVIMTL